MVEVTQADRLLVADILDEVSDLLDHTGIGQVADLIRDGEYDEHDCVVIATHHRVAAENAALEEAAKVDGRNMPATSGNRCSPQFSDHREARMLTDQQRADGWIEHDGGPCPVPLDSLVATIWDDGKFFSDCCAIGFTIWPENWEHRDLITAKTGERIIAYRSQ